MIITDYYRFEKLPNQHSKLRLDCTARAPNLIIPLRQKEQQKVQRATEHRDAIDWEI
jgi:hypothetical protein